MADSTLHSFSLTSTFSTTGASPLRESSAADWLPAAHSVSRCRLPVCRNGKAGTETPNYGKVFYGIHGRDTWIPKLGKRLCPDLGADQAREVETALRKLASRVDNARRSSTVSSRRLRITALESLAEHRAAERLAGERANMVAAQQAAINNVSKTLLSRLPTAKRVAEVSQAGWERLCVPALVIVVVFHFSTLVVLLAHTRSARRTRRHKPSPRGLSALSAGGRSDLFSFCLSRCVCLAMLAGSLGLERLQPNLHRMGRVDVPTESALLSAWPHVQCERVDRLCMSICPKVSSVVQQTCARSAAPASRGSCAGS